MRNLGSIFLLMRPRVRRSPGVGGPTVHVVDASFARTALHHIEFQEGADDAPSPDLPGALRPGNPARRPMTTAGRAGRRRES
jgi:hypothetical protein